MARGEVLYLTRLPSESDVPPVDGTRAAVFVKNSRVMFHLGHDDELHDVITHDVITTI